MSLTILFRDELVADQRCTLSQPHAIGQIYNAPKLRVAADNTFAYGIVGPTLSKREHDVLEAIIANAFKSTKGDAECVTLGHSEWFKQRNRPTIMVMTKIGSYYFYPADESSVRQGYNKHLLELTEPTLVRFDPEMPAGSGTGMQAANVALMEGVAMKDLMPLVAKVIHSVGPEFDLVHRKTLKGMKRV